MVKKFRNALYIRVAAAIEHAPVLNILNQNNCNLIVDIGANKGQFSLAAKEFVPYSKIIAFEPLRAPAEKYDLLFSQDSDVTMYRCAIGNDSGSSDIHVSNKDDSSSLLPITEKQNNLFPGTSESHVEQIDVRTLDAFVSNRDISGYSVLKIDVQGSELDVLKGCRALIQGFSAVYVECSFIELYKGQALAHEVVDFLHKYNFILDGVYNQCYDRDGRAVQADFFFVSLAT